MGLFSKKKKDGDSNPYAQDGSQVPYSNPMTPYQQARNNMAQGQAVGVGLPSGPRAGGSASSTPAPSYHSPSIASSNTRFGDEKYGSQNGYGSDRYGNNGSAPVAGRGAGGYGGFDNDAGKNDLFGGAGSRPGAVQSNSAPGAPTARPGDNRNPALFGNAQDRYNPYSASQPQGGAADAGDEYGGYGAARELTEEEREEQEIQAVKDETKAVRKAGLESLDRSIATGRAGLDQIFATRMRLAQQEEMLQNTEQKLDLATIHAKDGTEKTKTLDKLNRTPFFVPVGPGKKARTKQVEAAMERHREEREIREQTRRDGFAAQQRMEETTKQLVRSTPGSLGASKPTSSRFKFEEDEEDEQDEREINDKLDDLGGLVGTMNQAASLVGEDINQSIQRLNRIGDKTDVVDDNVRKNRAMLNHIK